MYAYEGVADVLSARADTPVFGVLGHGNYHLLSDFSVQHGGRFVPAWHEAGAIGMADGWARASGRVGVCALTHGPGLTNAITGLVTAARARTPLVVLAGDVAHRARHFHTQAIEQGEIFAAAEVELQPVTSPASMAADVATALARAAAEGRTIGVNLPADWQLEQVAAEDAESLAPGRATTRPGAPDGAAVDHVAELIAAAARPVILAGRGAYESHAGDALRALGASTGALLGTTLRAKGLFAGDAFDVGNVGGYTTNLARELLGQADALLAFGAGLNTFTLDGGLLFDAAATVVQCDADMNAASRAATPIAHALVGDARAGAVALLQRLRERGADRTGFRTDGLRARLAAFDPESEFDREERGGTVDPRTAVISLERMLPRERVVVVDGGHVSALPCMYMSAPEPTSFLHLQSFGAIGLGLGVALGAAIARPDRLAVLVTGDGALQMASADLQTAVRHGLRLLVVVLNDGAYGSEVHSMAAAGLPVDIATWKPLDFRAIARAVGGDGLAVGSAEELAAAQERLRSVDGLFVLDVHVPRTELPYHRRMMQRVFAEA